MAEGKKTPLYAQHLAAGAKMVEFAGWLMPVEYSGLRVEHLTVRRSVGLFDVSHMGEVFFRGPKACETLENLTTNSVQRLGPGQAQYSLMLNEEGGVVDDVIVYCVEPSHEYFVCVNAANTEKDVAWMRAHNRGAIIEDESAQWGQIAVQGPQAPALVSRVFGQDLSAMKRFHFAELNWHGQLCRVAFTGYTGERGFEIFVPSDLTESLWQGLLAEGQTWQVCPVGLGARDTLRTEMAYSLYGHEIDETTSPYEAGLGWVMKPESKDFIGKTAALRYRESGLKRRLVGLKLLEPGIGRQGYPVVSLAGREVGHVTSGTLSPSLGEAIAIAYLATDIAGPEVFVQVRQRRLRATIVPLPFLKAGAGEGVTAPTQKSKDIPREMP